MSYSLTILTLASVCLKCRWLGCVRSTGTPARDAAIASAVDAGPPPQSNNAATRLPCNIEHHASNRGAENLDKRKNNYLLLKLQIGY